MIVPVAEVLVPLPGTARRRALQRQLGVPVIDLLADQLLDGIDDAGAAGDRAEHVVGRMVPERQPHAAPCPIGPTVSLLVERLVRLGRAAEQFDLFPVEQAALH